MDVTFWGTRGSIPTAGADTLRYGGNTSCVEVRTGSGELIVLDCGTGAHILGRKLAQEPGLKASLLISHTHWDHIQGVPFFAPLFIPGNEWDIYAPRGLGQSLRDTLAGQMQYTYFPITLEAMGANIRFHELVEGAFEIGDATIRTQYLDHPALTLAYRIEADGASMVYASDHEPLGRKPVPTAEDLATVERRHVEFLAGADLVIHDGQYTVEEYPEKVAWGHSTPDYAAAICRAAGVKRLALTHHDPTRTDDAVDAMVADIRAKMAAAGADLPVEAAAEGATITLANTAPPPRPEPAEPEKSALEGETVALGPLRPEVAAAIEDAAAAQGLPLVQLDEAAAARASLIVLDDQADGAETARAISAKTANQQRPPAQLVVTDGAPPGLAYGETRPDWVAWPFSETYGAAKLRAAVMRVQCRWIRAELPENEGLRIQELHRLEILDTEPEERFDRITRIASEAFAVPVALVTLIDSDRQFMKSCVGTEALQMPREMAFCAHTVVKNDVLVAPDTLLDDRFADNPLVVGGPRVRFYAGCPIRSGDAGAALGSICLIDIRPRELSEGQIALLKDFGKLVEAELQAATPA